MLAGSSGGGGVGEVVAIGMGGKGGWHCVAGAWNKEEMKER